MPATQKSSPASYPTPGQATLLMIVALALQIGSAGVVATVAFAAGTDSSGMMSVIMNPWALGCINILSIGLALTIGLRATKEAPRTFLAIRPFPLRLLGPITVTSLGLALVLSEVDNVIMEVFKQFESFRNLDRDMLHIAQRPVGAFFLILIVAPLTEEYLYRHMILRGLLSRLRWWPAILYSAVLFGLMHANLRQLVLGTVIGSVFGWWYARTRSVGPGIVGHAIFNAVAYTAAVWPEFYSPLGIYFGTSEVIHQPWWFTGVGALWIALGVYWSRLIPVTPPDPPPPEPPLLSAGSGADPPLLALPARDRPAAPSADQSAASPAS